MKQVGAKILDDAASLFLLCGLQIGLLHAGIAIPKTGFGTNPFMTPGSIRLGLGLGFGTNPFMAPGSMPSLVRVVVRQLRLRLRLKIRLRLRLKVRLRGGGGGIGSAVNNYARQQSVVVP